MQVEDYLLHIDPRLAEAGFERISAELYGLNVLRVYRRERVIASLRIMTFWVALPGPSSLTIPEIQQSSSAVYHAVASAFPRAFWSTLIVAPLLLSQTVPAELAVAFRDNFRVGYHFSGMEAPVLVDLARKLAYYAESGLSNNSVPVYYFRKEARGLLSFSANPEAVVAGPEPVLRKLSAPPLFVSYRREDSAYATGRLCDRLTERFGRESIFRDVDSIPLGVDFKQHIAERVGACRVFLAVIGRHWLTTGEGRRRIDDPDDFVRLEIESALARGVPVVPVLVEGARLPVVEDLPASIQPIVFRNGIPIRHDPDFHSDVDRLLRGLYDLLQEPSR